MATIRNLLLRLGVDVDPLDRGFAKAAKTVEKFDKHFSKVAKAGAIGAGLGAATGAATAFSAALAPAAGSLIAMPGALIGAKTAIGVFKLGIMGVGDAMSAVADGDAKKLKAALKDLSPNAREFVKESGGFLKAFDPVKSAVQDKIFEGLAKQIDPLSKKLLPTLKTGMLDVAGGFNAGAKEVAAFAATPFAKGGVEKIFSSTAAVMATVSGAIQPALKGVTALAIAGMPLAQRMAEWAANGIKAAAAFTTSEAGASRLAGWAQKAGDTLAQMGQIAGNLGRFLGGVFESAKFTGDGVLDTIIKITARMAEFSQSAEGQKRLTEAFTLLLEILHSVVDVLPVFMGPLGLLAKMLTSMSPEVRGVVTQFLAFSLVGVTLAGKLTGLLSVVKGLAVGTMAVGGTFLEFGKGMFAGAAGLDKNAGMAAKAGAAFRTLNTAVWTGIQSAGAFVATNAKLAFEHGKVAIASAAAATKQAVLTAAQWAGNVASKALAVGIRLVNAAMRANPIGIIITILTALVAIIVVAYKKNETFRNIVDAVWKGIRTAISAAWNGFIKPAFNAIVAFITGTLIPKMLWLYNNVIKPVWSNVGKAISTVWNGVVKPVFSALATFITKTVPNAFNTGVKAIGTFWGKVEAIAKKPVTFMVNTIYNNGIRKIWNWVADKIGIGGQLPEIKGFRTGGPITQGTHGTADDVLMKASRGEYVVNAASTRRNAGLIDYVNRFGKNRDVLRAAGFAGDPGGLGIPGYAEGGIVGWVKGFIDKGKDFFMSGFYKAAQAALNPIGNLARAGMGTTGIGGLLSSGVQKIISGMLDKFKPLEDKLGGGGGGKVIAAARSQIGVPYSWGGGGPGGPSYGIGRGAGTRGFDCSGLTEYAWYKAIGRSIGGTTYAQRGILQSISSPRPGAVGQPHPGHTYLATGKGTIIEAPFTGGFVREVPFRAAPWWGWPKGESVMDDGGVIRPGWNPPIFNGTGKTEGVFTADMMRSMASSRGGNTYNLTYQAAPGQSPAEIGRQIVSHIKEFERTNGTRWRGNP